MGLRAFKVESQNSFDMDEQFCDLMVLLFVWCYLLANNLAKSIVIISNQLCMLWMKIVHGHELGFMGISSD